MSKAKVIIIIASFFAAFFASSCSKEDLGDNLEGMWGVVLEQGVLTLDGKIVAERYSDNYDPFNPVNGSEKYSIVDAGNETYLVSPYTWYAKTSTWKKNEGDSFSVKRIKGNTYSYIDNEDEDEITISFSESNTVMTITFTDEGGPDLMMFYQGMEWAAPKTQTEIDEYVKKGAVVFNGYLEKVVLKRMTPISGE